ncbi:NAD(P)-dependent oxidoreductase [Oenococcus sicerae]|uniref:NAD(P)-dependent oxidoreductase n=1 Tax=Oenococcus sicerae TaxID=2203724 RepID=UPI0010B1DE29|nr:hypothetical protein OAL24_01609 [Oenococcus sicerae]
MKIFVIGATGMAGSAIAKEAVSRGIEVLANGRSIDKLQALKQSNTSITILAKDAFALELDDFENADVIIDAFAAKPAEAYLQVDLASKLIALFRNNKSVRLAFILGAGSLLTGQDNHLAVQDIETDPTSKPWRAVPQNQLKELNFLKQVDNVDWFGVSPALSFVPGPRAAKILFGEDHLLFNENGQSETTAGTMAAVVVNEILNPKYHQKRFTAANA